MNSIGSFISPVLLHGRPCAAIVKFSQEMNRVHGITLYILSGGKRAGGNSIISLLGLGVPAGSSIEVQAEKNGEQPTGEMMSRVRTSFSELMESLNNPDLHTTIDSPNISPKVTSTISDTGEVTPNDDVYISYIQEILNIQYIGMGIDNFLARAGVIIDKMGGNIKNETIKNIVHAYQNAMFEKEIRIRTGQPIDNVMQDFHQKIQKIKYTHTVQERFKDPIVQRHLFLIYIREHISKTGIHTMDGMEIFLYTLNMLDKAYMKDVPVDAGISSLDLLDLLGAVDTYDLYTDIIGRIDTRMLDTQIYIDKKGMEGLLDIHMKQQILIIQNMNAILLKENLRLIDMNMQYVKEIVDLSHTDIPDFLEKLGSIVDKVGANTDIAKLSAVITHEYMGSKHALTEEANIIRFKKDLINVTERFYNEWKYANGMEHSL